MQEQAAAAFGNMMKCDESRKAITDARGVEALLELIRLPLVEVVQDPEQRFQKAQEPTVAEPPTQLQQNATGALLNFAADEAHADSLEVLIELLRSAAPEAQQAALTLLGRRKDKKATNAAFAAAHGVEPLLQARSRESPNLSFRL